VTFAACMSFFSFLFKVIIGKKKESILFMDGERCLRTYVAITWNF
jgi:hypothetical protein